MTIGSRIAHLRKQQGLTQADLAKRLSVCPSTVGMYEQGRREPSSALLATMAQVFHVSISYLLTGDEQIGTINSEPYGFLVVLKASDSHLLHPVIMPLSQKELQQINKIFNYSPANPHNRI